MPEWKKLKSINPDWLNRLKEDNHGLEVSLLLRSSMSMLVNNGANAGLKASAPSPCVSM